MSRQNRGAKELLQDADIGDFERFDLGGESFEEGRK